MSDMSQGTDALVARLKAAADRADRTDTGTPPALLREAAEALGSEAPKCPKCGSYQIGCRNGCTWDVPSLNDADRARIAEMDRRFDAVVRGGSEAGTRGEPVA